MHRRRVHVDDADARLVEHRFAGDGPVVLAPHGGFEPGTAWAAMAVRERLDCAAWVCHGSVVRGWEAADHRQSSAAGAFERFHVPSTELDPAEWAFLGDVLAVEGRDAVAVHGVADPGTVVVGGAAPRERRESLRAALAARLPGEVAVEIHESGAYAGVSPANVVNRAAADGGLQVEAPPRVRADHAGAVADAVAAVLEN